MNLPELIELLSKYNVRKFKGLEYEIELDSKELDQKSDTKIAEPPLPAGMPKELHNLDAMTADQVLNWSAGPGEEKFPLPLTDDKPITAD